MQERADNFLAAFKREPEQTKWLLRFGVGGPLAIVAWDFAGNLIAPGILVGLVDLLAIMTYGAVLSLMIMRIAQDSERWTVEAAVTARKFSNRVQGRDEDEADHQAEVHSGFQQAHFLARLKDDIAGARRGGEQLSVVWLEVNVAGFDPLPAQTDKMALDVAELLASQSRTIGMSLDLNLNEYVFTIPHEGKPGAHAFVSKLILGLGRYWCHCGIAEYPGDGTDAETLFAEARKLCDASRQGKDATRVSHGRIAAAG